MKTMINTEKLKKDLVSMRYSKDQSMDTACKEIGISKPTYSRMENGNTPDALTLLKESPKRFSSSIFILKSSQHGLI